MRAFWRHIELAHLNVALLALIGLLILAYRPQLTWALRGLPLYAAGGFPAQVEFDLARFGVEILQRGGDRQRARRLLERALAIDPHSSAGLVLAELNLREGRVEEALQGFRAFQAIDPGSLRTYLRIAEIQASRGRHAEERAVLERGVEVFRSRVESHRPVPDPGVDPRFNDKARAVFDDYREGLATLRDRLARHEDPATPP